MSQDKREGDDNLKQEAEAAGALCFLANRDDETSVARAALASAAPSARQLGMPAASLAAYLQQQQQLNALLYPQLAAAAMNPAFAAHLASIAATINPLFSAAAAANQPLSLFAKDAPAHPHAPPAAPVAAALPTPGTDPLSLSALRSRPPDEKARKKELKHRFSISKHKWEQRFQELLEYKAEMGDCEVAYRYPKNKKLGVWVSQQRSMYRLGMLDADRFQRLDDVGFVWEASLVNKSRKDEVRWEHHFKELLEYKKTHGDFNVPTNYPPNPTLGKWTATQRAWKKENRLRKDRLDRLTTIGFQWDAPRNRHLNNWNSFFELLQQYKQEGSSLAEKSMDDEFVDWMVTQRVRYHRGDLPQKQIAKLDLVGFDWGEPPKNHGKQRPKRHEKRRREEDSGSSSSSDESSSSSSSGSSTSSSSSSSGSSTSSSSSSSALVVAHIHKDTGGRKASKKTMQKKADASLIGKTVDLDEQSLKGNESKSFSNVGGQQVLRKRQTKE